MGYEIIIFIFKKGETKFEKNINERKRDYLKIKSARTQNIE